MAARHSYSCSQSPSCVLQQHPPHLPPPHFSLCVDFLKPLLSPSLVTGWGGLSSLGGDWELSVFRANPLGGRSLGNEWRRWMCVYILLSGAAPQMVLENGSVEGVVTHRGLSGSRIYLSTLTPLLRGRKAGRRAAYPYSSDRSLFTYPYQIFFLFFSLLCFSFPCYTPANIVLFCLFGCVFFISLFFVYCLFMFLLR